MRKVAVPGRAGNEGRPIVEGGDAVGDIAAGATELRGPGKEPFAFSLVMKPSVFRR